MKTYKLNSGYEIPLFGLGTWKSDNEEELYKAIREAINIGYRHIDCAKIYGNEHVIGKALNFFQIFYNDIIFFIKLAIF